MEANEPEKKIPSTAAKATRRSANEPLEEIHLNAQSAFFLIQGTVEINDTEFRKLFRRSVFFFDHQRNTRRIIHVLRARRVSRHEKKINRKGEKKHEKSIKEEEKRKTY